jgi:hypothetical protein
MALIEAMRPIRFYSARIATAARQRRRIACERHGLRREFDKNPFRCDADMR